MNVQVLVSTMNQKDYTLLDKMNIQTDAIIINQCTFNEIQSFLYKEKKINYFNLKERGIGLSRNTALMRATSDICLFADDDVVYVDGYEKIIIDGFKNQPDADVIIFNVPSTNKIRPTAQIDKNKRVRYWNCLRYGAFCLAVKRESIYKKNINFSLLFGGGAKYSSGEDSLFIADCIKNHLKIYTNQSIIGYVNHGDSTWFEGYTKKYFIDKGIFFGNLSRCFGEIYCLYFALKRYKQYEQDMSLYNSLKYMIKGVRTSRR